MPKLPLAILFDGDGTLYDSEHLNFESNRAIAKRLYDFDLTWELYDTHVRRGSKRSYEVLGEHGILVDKEHYHAHKIAFFREVQLAKMKPLPGLPEFLEWCRKKSMKLAVVSAASHEYIAMCLKAVGIEDYFDTVVGHQDVGSNVKPDPHAYQLALELTGVAAEWAIAVEDTDKGITSAQAARLRCVAIRNDANTPAELAKADHLISDYSELKTYLLK